MNYIHPTAIVYPNVTLGDNVYIGPYCVIGESAEHPDVIDPRSDLLEGERVWIGDNTTIRSHVTIHAGIDRCTAIGDGCYIMSHSHVGHDVVVKDKCVLHTGAIIGGHSTIWENSRIGLNATLHPHTEVSAGSMIGAQSFVKGKLQPPFQIWAGVPAKHIGVNQKLLDKLLDESDK